MAIGLTRISDKSAIEKLEELGIGKRAANGYFIAAMEANYLVAKKIVSANSIKKQKVDSATYALYCYFMDLGYQVRINKDFLRVYERGRRRQSDVPAWLVKVVGQGAKFGMLLDGLAVAKNMRKQLVIATIDAKDGWPMFYSLKTKTV